VHNTIETLIVTLSRNRLLDGGRTLPVTSPTKTTIKARARSIVRLSRREKL
jgi:hypothetical protein